MQQATSKIIHGMRIVFVLLVMLICSASNSRAGNESHIWLTVAHGDTLIKICRQYLDNFRNWPKIARENSLPDANLIFPGQTLKIPVDLLTGIPVAGVVSFVSGDVQVKAENADVWQPLSVGDAVGQGSQIKTSDASNVTVRFDNGDSFLLREKTELAVQRSTRKGLTRYLYRFYLGAGRVISRVQKIFGSEPRYEIETPTAITGARGTHFRVIVANDLATRCEVLEGMVAVAAGSDQIEVNQGQGTVILAGQNALKTEHLLPPPSLVDRLDLYRTMPLYFPVNHEEGAVSSRLLLARDFELQDIVLQKTIPSGENFFVVGVDDGEYFLSATHFDRHGLEGMPLAPLLIRVRVNPLPPFIEQPENNGQYKQSTVAARWLKVPDAVRYRVQLAGSSDFTVLLADRDDIAALEYSFEELVFGRYFFRVCSLGEDGYQGVWSDPVGFEIIPPPPIPPMETPEVDGDSIRLRWQQLGPGIHYQLQVATDSEFAHTVFDQILEVPEVTMPRPQASGTYFVRSRGIDADGYEGNFSRPQSFEVARQPWPELMLWLAGVLAILL